MKGPIGIGNGGVGSWAGPIYTQFICYVKFGKLGFCECGFSNLLALKTLYLYER